MTSQEGSPDPTTPGLSSILGATGSAIRIVGHGDTAIAAGSGDLPVLGTPTLIALMEAAACDALAGHLQPHSTSVGAHVDVRHLAPSPIGAHVTALATVVGVRGAKVSFDVSAAHVIDGTAVEIGLGSHTRVVVDRRTFGGR